MSNPILYKYLDIEGAKKMLFYKNLQFTNATKFNDPLDCHPSLINFSNVPKERCKAWTAKDIEELVANKLENLRADTWIACLSKVYDSILMWSYYNSHRGVCIGLDTTELAKYINVSHGQVVCSSGCEVQYKNIIDKPDYFRDAVDFLYYQICTKAKAWEHEQEVRLFLINPFFHILRLPYQPDDDKLPDIMELRAYPRIANECFNSIYLGVNIRQKDKEDIIKLAREIKPTIKLYQMEVELNSFSLIPVEI